MRELLIVETGMISGGNDKFELPGFGTPRDGFISGAAVGAGLGMAVGSIPSIIPFIITYGIFGMEPPLIFGEPIALGGLIGAACGAPIGGVIGTVGYAAHLFY
jgi:hypothetical protein